MEPRYIPHIEKIAPTLSGKGLLLNRAITDGKTLYAEVCYNLGLPKVYSVAAVSPIRTGAYEHEIFVGKKFQSTTSGFAVWMPAVYDSVEIRIGVSPVEVVTDRLLLTEFTSGQVPRIPIPSEKIYMRESNVPKLIPSELKRFVISFPARPGVYMDYFKNIRWDGVYYHNFSVCNTLPLPNISYSLTVKAAKEVTTELDRQFWFSRDEIILITDLSPLDLSLRFVTLAQTLISKLGPEWIGKYGVVVDRRTL